ncbi:iron ABC transporter permease [Pseudonocardia sp. KRD291]|uniref:ABC transporter permease n=1 Tax=Pseudonocardia sp. KRD291 TaxID=2792007 RepID=UPI001C4A0FA9|nr:ABC transporter permease subunit [Pseudonocardia sp. KRD291]MBW0101012.1 iron ABC transporter permease [Pseudonocardia sp. KRD291]
MTAVVALVLGPPMVMVAGLGSGVGQAVSAAVALPGLGTMLLNTVIALVISTGCAVVLGCLFAWLDERTDAHLGWVSRILPVVPLLVPPIAGAIGWALLASPNAGFLNGAIRAAAGLVGIEITSGPLDVFSWPGLVFVYTLYLVPHVYLTVAAALRNLDPAMEEAARVGGAGPARVLRTVTLPSVRPAILGGALLAGVFGLALYSVPVILGTQARIEVLAVTVVRLLTAEFPPRTDVAIVLGLVLFLAVTALYLAQVAVLRRSRFATISGRAARGTRLRLGRWRAPSRALLLGYLLVTAVLPFLGLLVVSLQPFWSANIRFSALQLDAFSEVLVGRRLTRDALVNSVLLGLVAATAAVLGAAVIAYAARTYLRGTLRTLVNGITKLPGTMSHIVVALAFVAALAGPPFGLAGTVMLLFLAYVVLYLPQASVSAESALAQVGDPLAEASRVCGAPPGRTFRRVVLPLMTPGLAAGWALVFVLVSGDITASVMLAGTTNPVVGSVTLDLWTNGTYPQLAALSVVVTAVSAAVVLVSMRLTRGGGRAPSRRRG